MYHLIIDTETVGLPKNWNAPITDVDNWPHMVSLSWIWTDGVNRTEFDFIIKPDGYEIPKVASDIHGITTETAMEKGYDLDYVLDLFKMFWNYEEICPVVVGHNLKFDTNIISCELLRKDMGQMFQDTTALYDTMLSGQKIMGVNKYPKQMELYKYLFREEFEGAHSSLGDVRACEKIYFELLKRNK